MKKNLNSGKPWIYAPAISIQRYFSRIGTGSFEKFLQMKNIIVSLAILFTVNHLYAESVTVEDRRPETDSGDRDRSPKTEDRRPKTED